MDPFSADNDNILKDSSKDSTNIEVLSTKKLRNQKNWTQLSYFNETPPKKIFLKIKNYKNNDEMVDL